jgi:Na+/proline symporter
MVGGLANNNAALLKLETKLEGTISNVALFAIIFGTLFTASSLLGTAQKIQLFGFSYFIMACSDVLRTLLIGGFIYKMFLFSSHFSAAEVVGTVYGKSSRIICALCAIFFTLLLITIQIKWIDKTVGQLFNVNFNVGLLLSLFLTIFYFIQNGKTRPSLKASIMLIALPFALHYLCRYDQKSTVFGAIICCYLYTYISTDSVIPARSIIEFSLIILIIPIVFSEINDSGIPLAQTIAQMPKELFRLDLESLSSQEITRQLIMFCTCAIPIFNPLVIQRVRLAKSATQARNVFIAASATIFIMLHLVSLCSLAAGYIYPEIGQTTSFNSFLYLTDHLIGAPAFKGLIFCGLISVMFSTLGPAMATANIAIISDIIKNQTTITEKQEDLLIKISSSAMILIALILSQYVENVFNALNLGINLWASIVTLPFFVAISKIPTKPIMFYLSSISGITVNILYYYSNVEFIQTFGIVISTLIVNSLIFGTSYLLFRQKKVEC